MKGPLLGLIVASLGTGAMALFALNQSPSHDPVAQGPDTQNAQEVDMAVLENAYDFSFTAIDGQPLPFETFRGSVVLVVNTASFCGFTPQYEDLQATYDSLKDQGFVILGVPSNDFGRQEPGTAAEIKEFCEVNYSITFPLAEKATVRGQDAHPFYKWALEVRGKDEAPRWNFHKYLVDRQGRLVGGFDSATKPNSGPLLAKIEEALAAPVGS